MKTSLFAGNSLESVALTKEQSTELDNQQATRIAHLAGLFEGEGTFCLSKTIQDGKRKFRGAVTICNTDPGIINFVTSFYVDHDIPFHMQVVNRNRGYKDCWTVLVTRLDKMKQLIQLLLPYLVGSKREKAILLEGFIDNRMKHNGKGRSIAEEQLDKEELVLAAIRAASETTREAPTYWEEDIVRSA